MQRCVKKLFPGLSCAILFSSAGFALAAPADDIKLLLDKGKPDEAYQLGHKSPDLLGNPPFDFYFGIAAVNAGKPAEGVLALERFLLNFPSNEPARLELARGYYLAGQVGRAREEFESILASRPAPDVVRVINEYLDGIKERETQYKSSAVWYVELGGGHDSNVQSGVESPDISLPIFGEITLTDSAVRRGDNFTSVAGGVRFSVPLRRNVQLFGVLGGESRQNRGFDSFDQEYFTGGGGLSLTGKTGGMRLSLTQSTQTIDHTKYRDTATLGAEFGYQMTPTTNGIAGIQLAQFRYAGFNAVRDADYQALSLGIKRRLPGAWRLEYDFALSYAREDVRDGDRQELARGLRGGHLGMSISPLQAWTFSVGASVLKSDYRAADPLLQVTREDRFESYDLAASYLLTSAWTVRAEYSHSRNKSNLPLYEYKRNLSSLKLRYLFR